MGLLSVAVPSAAAAPGPILFERNEGQFDRSIDFLSRGEGYSFAISAAAARWSLTAGGDAAQLQMTLEGADRTARPVATGSASHPTNYFRGGEPAKWVTEVPSFRRVRYPRVYDGIDVEYYGRSGYLEYDFIVAPGADAQQIELGFEGARSIRVDQRGTLVIEVAGGELRHLRPFAYQKRPDGGVDRVVAEFDTRNDRIGFAVGPYDESRELVIDPAIVDQFDVRIEQLSTEASAVDASGNIVFVGWLRAQSVPAINAVRATVSGGGEFWEEEGFAIKVSSTGTIVYATYLGGNGKDSALGVVVDAAGNAYITGRTESTDFPTTAGAFQRALGLTWTPPHTDTQDVFVTKLSSTGSLVYSTYLGADGTDTPLDIALGAGGTVYVAGSTTSGMFPFTVDNRPQVGPSGGFVTKLSADGTSLEFSARIPAAVEGIAIEPATGASYITGPAVSDISSPFPTTSGVFAPACTAINLDSYCTDAYVMKLDSAGALQISTFFGGTMPLESGRAVAIDSVGNVHVGGDTLSNDLPTTPDAFQLTRIGAGADGFYAKFDGALSTLLYGTYLGGTGSDSMTDVFVDGSDRITIKGQGSTDYPMMSQFPYRDSILAPLTVLTQFNSLKQVQFSVGLIDFTTRRVSGDAAGNIYVAYAPGNFPEESARIRKISPTGSNQLIVDFMNPLGRNDVVDPMFNVICDAGEVDSGSRVFFGPAEGTGVFLVGPGHLRGDLPGSLPAGVHDVTVQSSTGLTGTLKRAFEVEPGTFSVTSISPSTVAAGSRGWVTISGTAFPPQADVTIAGGTTTSQMYSYRESPTTIRLFIRPDIAAGVYDVSVAGGTFTAITLTGALTITGPRVYGLNPAVLPTTGGQVRVSATQADVPSGTTVTFDGFAGTMGTSQFGGIDVTAPAHAAGLVDVVVTTPLGTVTFPDGLLYAQAVAISGFVTPSNGPPAGGTPITVTGTGFMPGARVTMDGIVLDDAIVGSTTITATTPAHPPRQVRVGVQNPDGGSALSSTVFTYQGPVPMNVSVRSPDPLCCGHFGPAAGGTLVSISGPGIEATSRVFFDDVEATVTGAGLVTTPPHPVGFADVIVLNADGTSGRLQRAFIFTGTAPAISGVSPATGPSSGGTSITISGSGFASNARVTVGGLRLQNVSIGSTSITGVTPPGFGSQEVRVTNLTDGQFATSTFQYIAAPAITYVCVGAVSSCSSASGPAAGGTSVRITGSAFLAGARVYFGGVEATGVVVNSATQIECPTPAHAIGSVDVEVQNTDGQSATKTNGYRYLPPAPSISSLNPTSAPPGVPVTITGTNFVFVTGVKFFSEKAALYTVDSATQITATVPAGAATGPITVTTESGSANSSSFTVEIAGPRVDSFTPATGGPGTSVVITGLRFTTANQVQFATVNAASFVVNSDTQITATAPANVVTGTVCVGSPDGTGCSSTNFAALPRVTGFTPPSALPDATITVNGANFQGATQVGFAGGANAAPATVAGDGTSLTVVVPAAAATGTVSVTTPVGTGTSTAVFTVPPVITSFSPGGGGPGTVVTINGARFTGATNVTFNGSVATFTVVSSSVITATVPQAFAAAGKIVVTTPGGTATSAANFTPGPKITFVTPGYGVVGALITIDGATYTGTTQVRFNGVPATFTVVSDLRITATVPAGATSGPVSVTGPSGTGTSANPFYLAPTITSFNPTIGYAGLTVVITGQNFLGTTNVTFNNVVSTFVVDSNTQITATVPGSAGTGPIRVHGYAATALGSTFTITAAPPPTLTAVAALATSVNIAWSGIAQQYDVQRSTNNSSWQNLTRITAVSYTDNTALANTVYFYRVVRVAGGATSNSDLATTMMFTDDPAVAGSTTIKAIHIEQLRTAINLVRVASGVGLAPPWTDNSLAGGPVKAVHITELRTALSAAVQALTGSPLTFTDPSLAAVPAKAIHLQELRNPVK